MSILKSNTNKIFKSNTNKILVKPTPIESLITLSNVVFWYNVNDVTDAVGTLANSTLKSRYVSNDAVRQTDFTRTYVQLDSEGYKCLRDTSEGGSYASQIGAIDNNNETFIGVMNCKVTFGAATNIIGGTPGGIAPFVFNYANYSSNGSVYIPGGPILNQKVIVVGVMTPTQMQLYVNGVLVGVLNSPDNSTDLSAKIKYIFWSQVNPTNDIRDYYCAIRIKEAVTGNKLKQLTRAVALEHGIKI